MTDVQLTPGITQEVHDQVMAIAEEIKSRGETQPKPARDLINQPMINNWVEAMGDTNPRYVQGEAPPAMAQVWTMRGLNPKPDPSDPLHATMGKLNELGFTGVLGTNCEQTYHRTLKVGEQVTVTLRLDSVVGPKATGVGEGYFVTSRNTWRVAGEDGTSEVVAEMLFRVLKFIPRPKQPPKPKFVLYPTLNRDTEFFYEGTAAGELRIQKCGACGALRHPPGPTCPECLEFSREYVVSPGTGTLFSYVVHRHPPIPGFDLPILTGVIELDEGLRMVATLDVASEDDLRIGMPVKVGFKKIDDKLTLPVFAPVEGSGASQDAETSNSNGVSRLGPEGPRTSTSGEGGQS